MQGIPTFITEALEAKPEVKSEQPKIETPLEQPEVKTPIVETPAEQPKVETPVFDFKTIDERIATPEDIKIFLSERDKYQVELEEAKKKLSDYNGYIKPADEEVIKFNEMKQSKGNVDLFLQMRGIDPQSLTEADAVKLMWQFQDGLTSQDADRKVKILYKTGKDINALQGKINESVDPDEKSRLEEELENIYLAQGELKANGKKAKEFLSTLKVKSQEVPQVPDVQKVQNEIRETWKPHASKFVPKDITIPFKVENPDKSVTELNVKFAVEGEATQKVNQFIDGTVEYFTSQGIPYNEKNAMDTIPSEVRTKILGENFEAIATRMVNTAIAAERERVKTAIHSPNKAGEKTENKGKEPDAVTTQFFNTVKAIRNGR